MLIDWFTVLAQIVNFLILVWILTRFLYRPILTAIDARAGALALTQASAAALTATAQATATALALERQEWERTRQERTDQAAREASLAAAAVLTQARAADTALSLQAATERAACDARGRRELVSHCEDQVFALAAAALAAMGSVTLEERITEVFMQRLATLDGHDRAAFSAAIIQGGTLTISSRFVLPEVQRQAITQALCGLAAPSPLPAPSFTQSPEAIAGITLSMAGFTTSWSLEGYLSAVRERLALRERKQQESLAAASAPLPPPSPPLPSAAA